jgi:hypothetical protein
VKTKIYDNAALDQQQDPAPGQPAFVELYARVCCIIVQENQRFHPVTGDPGKLFFMTADQQPEEEKDGQFHRSLLNRCQQEFERAPHDICEGLQLQGEVDRYNQDVKQKRRALGNADFVGQVFLYGLLAEKNLHHCFKLLLEKHYERFDGLSQPGGRRLRDCDFVQLESFGKLLTAVGGTVDRPLAKHMMDGYFHDLSQIMARPTIIPRMKFYIERIIELRNCNWDHASVPGIADCDATFGSSDITSSEDEDSDSSKACTMVLSGVKGGNSIVNGLYLPTQETGRDGRMLYRKSGESRAEALWIEHFEGQWQVKNEMDRGSRV